MVHINQLADELKAWLKEVSPKDTLRVVTGGPGCGKSSTAKVLAKDVAFAERLNVFFVPLQGLDVSQDIDAIIDNYVRVAGRNASCLPESPVNWVRNETSKKLLLIFDGLDEVARPGGADLEVTRKFLENLRLWLSQTNRGQEPIVMAVVLGRPAAAEDAALKIGNLDGRRLLYVEPLCELDQERLKREAHAAIEINDPYGLTQKDDRRLLWEKYAGFDDRYGDEEPEALKEEGFEDLTIEPLLLYLLMYSGLAGKDWPEAKENRNRIYEEIFARVHKRDKEEKPEIAIDKREDFFTLMECLGLAAWQGGGRTGSDEDFNKIRDEIYAPEKQKIFQKLDRAQLKNVAVQFYTHQGGTQDGYAFIHKSFGEYLTARALIKASEAWCQHHGRLNKWSSFAEEWLRLTGGQRITPEHLTFMVDEARLMVKPRSGDNLDVKKAQTLIEQLTEVATLTLIDGFPAHRILPISRRDADWRRRELNQRSAEMALYAALHAWAEAGYPEDEISRKEGDGGWQPGPIKVSWHEEALRPAVAMLGRLRDQWAKDSLATQMFTRWDFSDQMFGVIDLKRFNFFGANLRGADLQEADLQGADLRGADLRGADLSIRGIPIWLISLTEVDTALQGLRGADLTRANLSGADLQRAKLYGAILRGADLGGADLQGADLRRATLRGANCNRMNMDSAALQFAELSEAVDLEQEQIDKAYGNSKTKLPDGIVRPAHWLDDS